jgi:hypothetical protein
MEELGTECRGTQRHECRITNAECRVGLRRCDGGVAGGSHRPLRAAVGGTVGWWLERGVEDGRARHGVPRYPPAPCSLLPAPCSPLTPAPPHPRTPAPPMPNP